MYEVFENLPLTSSSAVLLRLAKEKFIELELDTTEENTFVLAVFKEICKIIGKEPDEYGKYRITNTDLQNLNKNSDKNCFNEIFEIVTKKFIKHVNDEEIQSATSIDTDIMFANGENTRKIEEIDI